MPAHRHITRSLNTELRKLLQDVLSRDLLWHGLTLLLLPFLAYYILLIWYRAARPDPEFLSFSASIVQIISIVTLLGLQTEWGKTIGRRLWRVLAKCHLTQPQAGFVFIALLTTIATATFYWGLPSRAEAKNQEGSAYLDEGKYSLAARAFRQAVSLAPENAASHYNLANAYESQHDVERAIAEYQLALSYDDTLTDGYNNLGQLLLLGRHDPDAALVTLRTGLSKAQHPFAQAMLHKNIGLVYGEKGLLATALQELTQAVKLLIQVANEQPADCKTAQPLTQTALECGTLDSYLAETHRLQALIYTKLGQTKDAKIAWLNSESKVKNFSNSPYCQEQPSAPLCVEAQILLDEAEEFLQQTP